MRHLVPVREGRLLGGGGKRVAGSAGLSLVSAATPGRPEPVLFEEMLAGWARQQQSRRLGESIIGSRKRTVRRFTEFSGGWPWSWSPAQLESWIAAGGWAHSTVRSYQGAVAGFLDYVCDPRYGWIAECEQQLGARPMQICHADNTAVHVADLRGSPPRRRAVAAVMPWAVESLEQYLAEVRPRYGRSAALPALWLTERGGRISPRQVDDRFALWRSVAGLPAELSVHSLRPPMSRT